MATQLSTTAQYEAQKKRHEALQHRRTLAEGKLEAETRALREAQAEAVAALGTSDLTELRALYEATARANDSLVVEFAIELDAAESGIAATEQQLAG